MEQFHPKVSIVIPVYNGANYMRDAIESALAQTYDNIEVIVVNDGSKDEGETDRIARSYGDKIRYFLKENGGVATALNLGIEKMTGEYFSWLSHDDMYTPTKIEEEVRCLSKQSDPTMIIAEGYQVVSSSGEYIATVNLHLQYSVDRLKNGLFVLMRGGINGCALLIHKSHFQRVGNFNPNLPTTQDYDLWFRMFRGQNVHYASMQNVLSRSHEEQGSKAMLDAHVKECDELWIGMINALTVEEKSNMSGSEYAFYCDIADFLIRNTGYKGAIRYVEEQKLCAAIAEYEQRPNTQLCQEICNVFGCEEQSLEEMFALRTRKADKKRILFYLEGRYEKGGLNRVVLQIAGLLAQQYDVIVTSSQDPDDGGYPTPNGVTELRLPWAGWSTTIVPNMSYMAVLLKTDVLVCNYNCVANQVSIYEAAKRLGIHTIAWSHEFYFVPHATPSLYNCLEWRNERLSYADAVVWLNSFSATTYNLFQNNGIQLFNPNPFDGKIAPDGERPKDLIAVARFEDPRKGLEPLLRMFAKVLEYKPQTTLYVVGSYNIDLALPSDSHTTYRKLIRQLGIPQQQLQFTGLVCDLEKYYSRACINILPSINEGFGLVILESATMGLPSVVFEGSGMDDIITDGVDGFAVPQGDWELLAQRVVELLEKPHQLECMSQAAIRMTARFSAAQAQRAWTDVIDAVLEADEAKRSAMLDKYRSAKQEEFSEAYVLQLARSYEACVSGLVKERKPTVDDSVWQREYQAMQREYQAIQQTLSWKITKPLRVAKKAMIVLKNEGFFFFIKKVFRTLLGK